VRAILIVFRSILIVICTLLFVRQMVGCVSQQQNQRSDATDEHLKRFLQNYIGTPTEETKATRYSTAFVDLRDEGNKEIVVYLTGASWCGTGGCTMLILVEENATFRVVTKIPAVRLPIAVLATKSNSWHDVSIVTGRPLYEAVLSFNGKTYQRKPARRSTEEVQRRVVITDSAQDIALYQRDDGQ